MLELVPAIGLFILLIYLFCRECQLDMKHYERLYWAGQAKVLSEFEKFKKEKGIE